MPDARATTVWIDTDSSIGSPFREVDDAFALLLAFKCSNLRIAGISTTYGNASLKQTTAVTTEFVGRFGNGVHGRVPKVYPGARSRKDLGLETVATKALAEVVQKNGSVTYITLGPLTNLATFEMLHPELAPRIHRVIFVGGVTEGASFRFGSRHPLRIHDANVLKDPEAVRRVLRANIPMTLIPIEAASQIMLGDEDLKDIGRNGEAGIFLRKKSRVWLWFWMNFVGTKGGPVFDAAAVVAAADPSLLVLETRYAVVDSFSNLLASRNPMPQSRAVLFCPRLAVTASQFVKQNLNGRGTDQKPRNSERRQP